MRSIAVGWDFLSTSLTPSLPCVHERHSHAGQKNVKLKPFSFQHQEAFAQKSTVLIVGLIIYRIRTFLSLGEHVSVRNIDGLGQWRCWIPISFFLSLRKNPSLCSVKSILRTCLHFPPGQHTRHVFHLSCCGRFCPTYGPAYCFICLSLNCV